MTRLWRPATMWRTFGLVSRSRRPVLRPVSRLLARLLAVACVLSVTAIAAPTAYAAALDSGAPPGTPTASSFRGVPTVGPLFRDGLDAGHECTASVIASPHHDLVITAAHCVFGTAVGWQVAPGYVRGRTPYGVWTVAAAYVPTQWAATGDTRFDYAILRMAPQRRHGALVAIEDVTGGNTLGTAPASGRVITDIAYNAGRDDRPIRCTVPAYRTDGYPSFNCGGYVGGSSGSPWLDHGVVRGVIGGLHQGGCVDYTSYSSPFTLQVFILYARAVVGGPGQSVPVPGGDGC